MTRVQTESFCHPIRRSRIKRRIFILGRCLKNFQRFRRTGQIDLGRVILISAYLKKFKSAVGNFLSSYFRNLKTDAHMTLTSKMIKLIWLSFGKDSAKRSIITKISIVKEQFLSINTQVLYQVLDPPAIKRTGSANNPMHLIIATFFQKQIGKIRTILTGDACDKGFFQIYRSIFCLEITFSQIHHKDFDPTDSSSGK